MNNAKVIAFYLPQFHRTKENDEWWGTGFTEWTNVASARPLFKGHYQPKIPTELGFYDLRFSEVRKEQAELAKKAGISAFCYWHYWLGNGKKLLYKPFEDVVRLGEPDFPFCLAWANHSWYKKQWKTNYSHITIPKGSTLLAEQLYPGKQDMIEHFYYLLDAFKDKRYYKIDGRLVFVIYSPLTMPDWEDFRATWIKLAEEEGLPGFFFIAHSYIAEEIEDLKKMHFDAINFSTHHQAFPRKETYVGWRRYISILHNIISLKPQIVEYSAACERMKSKLFLEGKIYPTIIPNWDHTPRSGNFGRCFINCTPGQFRNHVDYILNTIQNKKESDQVVFLKSWNEWGEGNYMEPDIKYGDAHIKVLRELLDDFNSK